MASKLIPRFHDATERPPRGGWHFFYDTSDGSTMFKLASPDEVAQELERYRRNNGTFVSAIDIERELWTYWCSLHPERCGQVSNPTAGEAGPLLPLEISPAYFGPIIWRFLNLAAVRFNREFFVLLVNESLVNLMTCPDCQREFAGLLERYPLTSVIDSKSACRWVNTVHNEVNAKLGKGTFSYEQMIRHCGAPLP